MLIYNLYHSIKYKIFFNVDINICPSISIDDYDQNNVINDDDLFY